MNKNYKTKAISFIWIILSVSIKVFSHEKPNFIIILTDDQSYDMLGCTGNNIIRTPNIDQLADDGVLFTNAHTTSAICTPSRISILTSQFERKHGVNFNSGTSLSEEAWGDTYPMVMRENGYFTGWIGKNHAPVGEGGYESGLMEKSFDYWYAAHGHLSFYPKDIHEIFRNANADTQVEIISEGVEDFLTNEQKLEGAIRFIDERPRDQPFILSINLNLPHGNGTSSMQLRDTDDEIYRTLYRDIQLPLPQYYIAKEDITIPKLPADLLHVADRQSIYSYVDSPAELKERYLRQLQAMTGIDKLVGNIRENLKEEGLDKNTIIIFTSDHGLFMGQFGLGGKALCYEVTTHVPMIIYNPKSKKQDCGITSDALVQSIDIAPTILKMANIRTPKSYQGKDLSKLLSNQEKKVREYLFTENLWSTHFGNPRCESVRDKDWKYIRYYKNNNPSARQLIETAELLGINFNKLLYGVNDRDMALYRSYIEDPIKGESPVYEELFYLAHDPDETLNVASSPMYQFQLSKMRAVWREQIEEARGSETPRVLRYTNESKLEKTLVTKTK
jgi:arylsulfatase A-like enzyme